MQGLVIFYDASSHWCLILLTQCRYKIGGISFIFQLLAGILLYRRDAYLPSSAIWSSVYRKDRINASLPLSVFKKIIKYHCDSWVKIINGSQFTASFSLTEAHTILSLASGIFKLPSNSFDKMLVIFDSFLAICYNKIFQGHLVHFLSQT